MITTLPLEVKKHSWWRSAVGRTFIIVELPIDWNGPGDVYYTRVGLLEYGSETPVDLTIEDFISLIDKGSMTHVKPIAKQSDPVSSQQAKP